MFVTRLTDSEERVITGSWWHARGSSDFFPRQREVQGPSWVGSFHSFAVGLAELRMAAHRVARASCARKDLFTNLFIDFLPVYPLLGISLSRQFYSQLVHLECTSRKSPLPPSLKIKDYETSD